MAQDKQTPDTHRILQTALRKCLLRVLHTHHIGFSFNEIIAAAYDAWEEMQLRGDIGLVDDADLSDKE